jgi:hypothetical protein
MHLSQEIDIVVDETLSRTCRIPHINTIANRRDVIWAPNSLCQQCEALNLATDLDDPFLERSDRLFTRNESFCPLCHFFSWALDRSNGKTLPPQDSRTFEVVVQLRFRHKNRWVVDITLYSKDLYAQDSVNLTVFHSGHVSIEGPNTVRSLSPHNINYSVLCDWIACCRAHHGPKCAIAAHEVFSERQHLRVIDCHTGRIVNAPVYCDYVALSYVWGRSAPTSTTTSSKSRRMKLTTLPVDAPRTIRDAMKVTTSLNLRYLWVDQYCIDQSDTADLHKQLSAMNQIYRFATVTIISAAGDSASYGLPGVSGPFRMAQPKLNLGGSLILSGLQNPTALIERSPWYSRAWTYQEGLLSRRRLIFTSEQVVFECDSATFRESLEHSSDPSHTTGWGYTSTSDWRSGLFKGAFQSRHLSFASHVRQYTTRRLTYQKDALNAMRGVFRAFTTLNPPIREYWGIPTACEAFMPDRYWAIGPRHSSHSDIYNMARYNEPSTSFSFGLLWHFEGVTYAEQREEFPSWSWAGWNAPIKWPPWNRDGAPYRRRKVKIMVDGGRGLRELTDAFIVGANDPRDQHLGRLPILHIQAEVLKLKFTHLTDTFVVERRWNQNCGIIWPLMLNTKPGIGGLLLNTLSNSQPIDCIILSGAYGLVVWGEGSTKTRIGTIPLRGRRFRMSANKCEYTSSSATENNLDCWLQNHVPSKIRTILLA